MCGIGILICGANSPSVQSDTELLLKPLRRRGPYATHTDSRQLTNERVVIFCGCVLHIRGQLTPQPVSDANGKNLFLWNGEIFGGSCVPPQTENDTQFLMDAIERSGDLVGTLKHVEGPFSFVYWDDAKQKLWIGRDCFGRRSLIARLCIDGRGKTTLQLTSVTDEISPVEDASEESNTDIKKARAHTYAPNVIQNSGTTGNTLKLTSEWSEIPADGVYCLDTKKSDFLFEGTSWKSMGVAPASDYNMTLPTAEDLIPVDTPHDQLMSNWNTQVAQETPRFIEYMSEAVRRRVVSVPDDEPNIMILFSGGVDSMLMAYLADRHIPKSRFIDLVNVAFENPRTNTVNNKKGLYDVPDRLTGRQGYQELVAACPDRNWQFVEVDVPIETLESSQPHIKGLLHPLQTVIDTSIGSAMWHATKANGRSKQQPYTPSSRVVLVGVGADEQLGGYSRHRTRFEVDPAIQRIPKVQKPSSKNAMKRKLDNTDQSSPSATNPSSTVDTDKSLEDICQDENKVQPKSRETISASAGWQRMLLEMRMDVDRIWTRNLGRDDRIISDHGREARFPFLDEQLVSYLAKLPIWIKTDPRFPRGQGEKILLRMALKQLGMDVSATEPKRAIQFGTRVARNKEGQRREKGSDIIK
ncbi:hypothetical protein SARC_03526 [Sphaeroforma arctica JP610]|uniref:Glutamine amidotransferase type-2 domain-containing protein n=1 Tax=Sphaeroforma arctica JP610 TaxID=667725 RepID=A0A0L0G5F1_9EUKA|nr:hypothetical protein SARC_03526 [Sphaeroforma arctica JP610]KNC84255.1 hypothetical protein SARC_03526 [Sphaeroforma arctica JP610]|eukprot:XP_014158157.1 hypothetical protein SARC_03526 [Sphaeroforma arctica JP610]